MGSDAGFWARSRSTTSPKVKWISSPPMPTPRHGEVVATVGNTVYVIGGANRSSHEGGTSTVEALDFS